MSVILAPNVVDNVRAETLSSVHHIVDVLADTAHRNVAQYSKSGALLASMRTVKNARGGRVFIGTDHWPYIEYGTKRHTIQPRYKKALWWPTAPYPVTRVRHPGTPEYAPMRRALASLVVSVT